MIDCPKHTGCDGKGFYEVWDTDKGIKLGIEDCKKCSGTGKVLAVGNANNVTKNK